MVHFTFKNGQAGISLSAHNSFKSFIIMVVMLVMTASSVFDEVIDGLRYKLDTKMKTAILLPNTEKNILVILLFLKRLKAIMVWNILLLLLKRSASMNVAVWLLSSFRLL